MRYLLRKINPTKLKRKPGKRYANETTVQQHLVNKTRTK
jgi:hypothetical protein